MTLFLLHLRQVVGLGVDGAIGALVECPDRYLLLRGRQDFPVLVLLALAFAIVKPAEGEQRTIHEILGVNRRGDLELSAVIGIVVVAGAVSAVLFLMSS